MKVCHHWKAAFLTQVNPVLEGNDMLKDNCTAREARYSDYWQKAGSAGGMAVNNACHFSTKYRLNRPISKCNGLRKQELKCTNDHAYAISQQLEKHKSSRCHLAYGADVFWLLADKMHLSKVLPTYAWVSSVNAPMMVKWRLRSEIRYLQACQATR